MIYCILFVFYFNLKINFYLIFFWWFILFLFKIVDFLLCSSFSFKIFFKKKIFFNKIHPFKIKRRKEKQKQALGTEIKEKWLTKCPMQWTKSTRCSSSLANWNETKSWITMSTGKREFGNWRCVFKLCS